MSTDKTRRKATRGTLIYMQTRCLYAPKGRTTMPSNQCEDTIHERSRLIGKFVSLWPIEKALRSQINVKWHPKGHITLQLGPKGFFIAIFNCLEDRNKVLDGGPYFFNVVGMFLRNGWNTSSQTRMILVGLRCGYTYTRCQWNTGRKTPYRRLEMLWVSLSRQQRKRKHADIPLFLVFEFI